jgi:hypothetical protein
MPEGYLGQVAPAQFEGHGVGGQLAATEDRNPAQLAAFLRFYHVKDVVAEAGAVPRYRYAQELASLGLHGVPVDGVLLYHIPSGGP